MQLLKQVLQNQNSGFFSVLAVFVLIGSLSLCSSPSLGDGGDGGDGDSVIPITLVKIEAGTFTMGGGVLGQRNVTFTNAFYMGKYEVTQAQWESVMGSNPSKFKSNPAKGEVQANRPVDTVSWYDALVFCNTLSMNEGLTPAYTINGSTDPEDWGTIPRDDKSDGTIDNGVNEAPWKAAVCKWNVDGYRLPTEAEWEYACRAGTTTAYNNGSDTISDAIGWIPKNSDYKSHEAGKKQPNKWGLYDMHGNITERCWDWAALDYPDKDEIDPRGPASAPYGHRVSRGGDWFSMGGGSAARSMGYPANRYNTTGFRLARSKM